MKGRDGKIRFYLLTKFLFFLSKEKGRSIDNCISGGKPRKKTMELAVGPAQQSYPGVVGCYWSLSPSLAHCPEAAPHLFYLCPLCGGGFAVWAGEGHAAAGVD